MGITGPAFGQIEIDGNKSLSISTLFILSAKFWESLLDVIPVSGTRLPYFAMYDVHFFAQIFERKIRMCITHGQ